LLHLVGSSILFYVIDDARTNKNQVYIYQCFGLFLQGKKYILSCSVSCGE